MNDPSHTEQTVDLSGGAPAAREGPDPEQTLAEKAAADPRPKAEHSGGTTEWIAKDVQDVVPTIETMRGSASDDADFSVDGERRKSAPAPRPDVAGYEILDELGRGGMGVVYKARQIKLHRLVALKMVLGGGHAGAHQLARFETEAKAVAQLQHPNIVQIYEVGEHEGLPYFSLELLLGGSLSDKIDKKPMPPRDAAATVLALAQAMAAAHQHGVIHRDLKPSNVLYSAAGAPKITDFGLAKQLEGDSKLTRSGTVMGTPSYMSPEQARGEGQDLGPLSDLYSLGAILYELLTGRPPFVGTTMLETLYQVRHQEPVPPARLQPKCPRDLETICLKCLQKEADRRYPDCASLAQDLSRYLAGEPIHARPVGRIERGWRWCKRNPRVAVLSGAVAALVLTVAAAAVIMGLQASRERQAVAESRKTVAERLQQAEQLAARGNYQRAQELLGWSDALLMSHADLADLRGQMTALRRQVDVYGEFKSLLDNARFACRFGSREQKEKGRQYCASLLELVDEIDGRRDRAAAGLPPLDSEEAQHYKEDVYEAYLLAALVEQELAQDAGTEAQQKAARQSIEWLNRADQLLPGTRMFHVFRAPCWKRLGNDEADQADIERALKIEPTLPSDRFWRGVANHMRGDQAKANGNAKDAEDYYRKEIGDYGGFLQLRPDHFWGYFNWAVCHFELGDWHDSWVGFTTCIRLRPDFPWPFNNRGIVHLRLGQLDLAVADFSAALERNDRYAEAYANRGLAYVAQKKADFALRDFDQAIAISPAHREAYEERAKLHRQQNRLAEAIADYTRLLSLSADRASVYAQRAATYRDLKKVDEAIKDYDELVVLRPKDAQAFFARAGLHYGRGDYGKAHADFSRVLEIEPRAKEAVQGRAVVNLLHLRDFEASLIDWERLTALQPKDAEPFRCIGVIQLGRRNYEQAWAALERAVALKSNFAEACWARAQIQHWQGRHDKALAELAPLVDRLPAGPPETLNVRGDVYRTMGRLKEAAADYERLIQLKPDNEDAYVGLALVCELEKQPVRARRCYEQLVAAAPQSARAYLLRAASLRDRGEFSQALEDCATAASKDPASTLVPLVRAGIKAAHGQHEEAVADAEQALKAVKNDGRALYAAACVWSLASSAVAKGDKSDTTRAKVYADRAAALLADALDRGFHDLVYPEHNRMPLDPALAAVRTHPRVRALLAREPSAGEQAP